MRIAVLALTRTTIRIFRLTLACCARLTQRALMHAAATVLRVRSRVDAHLRTARLATGHDTFHLVFRTGTEEGSEAALARVFAHELDGFAGGLGR
jgi:hypothetical protein